MTNEDIVEASVYSVDKDLHCKKTLVVSFDSRDCSREKIWVGVSRADDVTHPLRTVSQKHKEELMKSLKLNKYQYVVGFMTLATLVCKRFGAVRVYDIFERQGAKLFLTKICGRYFRRPLPSLLC